MFIDITSQISTVDGKFMNCSHYLQKGWLGVINISQRQMPVFHLSHMARFEMMTLSLSAWLRHIKQNKKTTSLQFIAKAKCSCVNDFGITLSENHLKCAMGSNSSIFFDLQRGGEEEGLGHISYHGICDPCIRTIQCTVTEWLKYSDFCVCVCVFVVYLCSCRCVLMLKPFQTQLSATNDESTCPSKIEVATSQPLQSMLKRPETRLTWMRWSSDAVSALLRPQVEKS